MLGPSRGVPRPGRPCWALGRVATCPCGSGTCSPLTSGRRNSGNQAHRLPQGDPHCGSGLGHFSPKSCRPMRKQRVRVGACTSREFGAQAHPDARFLSASSRRKATHCASHTLCSLLWSQLCSSSEALLQKETLSPSAVTTRGPGPPPPCPWPAFCLRMCLLWAFHRSRTARSDRVSGVYLNACPLGLSGP